MLNFYLPDAPVVTAKGKDTGYTAPTLVPPPAPERQANDDIEFTSYIGQTISADEWNWLQDACRRVHDGLWTLKAVAVGNKYRVTGLSARPETEETL